MDHLFPRLTKINEIAKILDGLVLTLPGLFRIQTRRVPLTSHYLVLVMIGAMVFPIYEAYILVNLWHLTT